MAYYDECDYAMATLEDEEKWKDIPGYEGHYKASTFGRIKSLKYNKETILKTFKQVNGYLFIILTKDGKQKRFLIHRLILKTFAGSSKLDCNHKDGMKNNNYLSNLEYCTKSENQNHAMKIGLKPAGEKHKNSKLTNTQVKEIREDNKKTIQSVLAKKYNVTRSLISMIQNNKIWRHI